VARIAKTDALVANIGGHLTEAEAKTLILKKLYDVANQELNRYLSAEKRRLIQIVENLWNKYTVSSCDLESANTKSIKWISRWIGVSEMNTHDGWETKRFDEIGTIFSGSTPSTSIGSFWNGEIVWITPYDLSRLNSPYLSDSSKCITEKGLNGCSAHLLPAGSVVISSRAPIGYVALPTVPFCTNQGCKTIKLKNAYHPEFVYYNILFNIDKVKNLGEGTTFAEISKAALSTIELLFPSSLPEQTKIAEILSTVDRAIEHTEALIAKQQHIKTGLMQDLLTRGIDEHGNLRFEQTHAFKDSPLGRIPVEWEVYPISKFGSTNRPWLRTGPFGSDLNTKHWVSHGVPVLTIGSPC
jgi:restriction endonuclease S subunit